MSINMTKNFSFRQKSDEELLQLLRKGISEARDVLSVRMFRLKDKLTEKVCVEASRYLDPWDLNEAFFLAYLNAEKNFDENKDVKFLTYLCEIYRNQVSSFARKSISQREFYCSISLDQAISYEDMDTTYHEIIFDKKPDEIKGQFALEDILAILAVSPEPFPSFTSELVTKLYEGYTPPQISKLLGIPVHQIRNNLKQIKAYLSEVLSEERKND